MERKIATVSGDLLKGITKITIPEAIKALQYLRLCEEQQETGDGEIITRLTRHEKEQRRECDTLVEGSITIVLT